MCRSKFLVGWVEVGVEHRALFLMHKIVFVTLHWKISHNAENEPGKRSSTMLKLINQLSLHLRHLLASLYLPVKFEGFRVLHLGLVTGRRTAHFCIDFLFILITAAHPHDN